jgi:hypothetical protein
MFKHIQAQAKSQLNGIKDKIKKLFISTQDEIMVKLNEMKDKITGMERTQCRMKVRQDCFSYLQLCMDSDELNCFCIDGNDNRSFETKL